MKLVTKNEEKTTVWTGLFYVISYFFDGFVGIFDQCPIQ